MKRMKVAIWLVLSCLLIAIPVFAGNVRTLNRGDSNSQGRVGLSDASDNWWYIDTPSLAANWTLTVPNAVPTTAGIFLASDASGNTSWSPAQRVLYTGLSASASHAGDTSAETVVMPTTQEGTAATDIADANLSAGAICSYEVLVSATSDVDGNEDMTVKVYFGAQEVGSSGAIAIDGATTILLDGTVNIRITGAAGTGIYKFNSGSIGTVGATLGGATFASFDTTATQAFSVKLDWGGTTDAADTATVELLNLTVNNFD